MNDQKKKWVWVGVAVVAIVVVATIVVWFMHRGQVSQQAAVVPVVHAPAGQVIAGFPQQMILGTASSTATSGVASFLSGITDSYSINYSSSTNQYTAEWVSSSTAAALYAQYQKYVTTNGWTITNHGDTPSLKNIYATNASSSIINIVITPQSQGAGATNKGAKVGMSYVSTAQTQ